MQSYVRAFIRSSLLWLVAGVTLGVLVAARPQLVAYRPAHLHANLLGFVAMMIFGVAYHVMPRFVGAPLHDERLARLHLVLANAGLAAMVAGFIARAHMLPVQPVIAVGGATAAVGAVLFAWNIWRTLDAAPAAELTNIRGTRNR